jgi:hyperosmotically inducible periplasmic protein
MKKSLPLKAIAAFITSAALVSAQAYADDSATTPAKTVQLPATTTNVVATDNAIKATIQSALPDNLQQVKISVNNGIVTLAGQLNSNTDYEHVVTIAQSTHGVSDVNVENLTVKDSQNPLSDTLITAKIKGAILKADILGKDIPTWSVHVETKNGNVYLSGTLATPAEKQNVLDVVKSVPGVGKINDGLLVTDSKS